MPGLYGQTVYGMYGTNPEDAGTGTILVCLLGVIRMLHRNFSTVTLVGHFVNVTVENVLDW